ICYGLGACVPDLAPWPDIRDRKFDEQQHRYGAWQAPPLCAVDGRRSGSQLGAEHSSGPPLLTLWRSCGDVDSRSYSAVGIVAPIHLRDSSATATTLSLAELDSSRHCSRAVWYRVLLCASKLDRAQFNRALSA